MVSARKESMKSKPFMRALFRELNGCCYLCGKLFEETDIVTKDHVFPKSTGYALVGNMMPSHSLCNREKGDRAPTLDEINFACVTYEKLGFYFYPKMTDSMGTVEKVPLYINLGKWCDNV